MTKSKRIAKRTGHTVLVEQHSKLLSLQAGFFLHHTGVRVGSSIICTDWFGRRQVTLSISTLADRSSLLVQTANGIRGTCNSFTGI